ncbi:MAG: ASCH domain-containing protein [Bacilli bacterium]
MKGLIIRAPWIHLILSGQKTWEIRGANTRIRGRIALIQSGTGQVYGTVDLVDCAALDWSAFRNHIAQHRVAEVQSLPYPKTFAWIMAHPVRLDKPVAYQHPQGAVLWVNGALDDDAPQISGVFVRDADARPVQ